MPFGLVDPVLKREEAPTVEPPPRASWYQNSKTKEPHGRSKTKLPESVAMTDTGGEGVAVPVATSSIYKVTIDNGLSSCMDVEKSIATQIGKSTEAKEILKSASEALIHKMFKDRETGDEEGNVKRAVLEYIGQWLATAKSVD
jgi:hypothetical protein